METCDVLVVGAGPTGLVAAAALAERGVDVRLVERAPERLTQSRALVVQPRTLELMDKMGLADGMVQAGVPAMRTNFNVDGNQLLSVDFGAAAFGKTAFPFVLFLSQVDTERILDDHLDRLGLPIEREVELVRIEQATDHVVARLLTKGVEVGLRCRYLIGADGAHSTVRHALGLPFEGDAYRSDFVLGDVRVSRIDRSLDELHIFLGASGFCALFPLTGGRTRIIATRREQREGELSLEELAETARSFLGPGVQVDEPEWLSRFHLHHRGTPRYREGRCFVAGDAAHIHSPAGGQGMNTGMQDAYNLAWKLGDVLRGRADSSLLDSYDEERHPVGQKLLSFTDRAFAIGAAEHPWLTPIRNFLAPHVVPRVAGLGGPERVFGFVSQLQIRYRRSSVVAQDLDGADAAFRAGPQAGDRAPGVDFLRTMGGTGWWLLGFTGVDDAIAPPRWRALLEACAVDREGVVLKMVEDPAVHALYGLSGPGLYLVRPDGHIAFRSAGMRVDPLNAWWAR